MRIAFDLDWYPMYGKSEQRMTQESLDRSDQFLRESAQASGYPLIEVDKGHRYTPEETDRLNAELIERSGLGKFGILPDSPEYPTVPEVLPMIDGQMVSNDDSHYRETLEVYYFQLRNSVAFVHDAPDDVLTRRYQPYVQQHRNRVMLEAVKLTNFQFRTGKIVIPYWLEDIFWELETNLRAEAMELWREAAIRMVQARSFHVYVRLEESALCLSLLLKAHLQSLLSAILNVRDARSMLGDKLVRQARYQFVFNILSHLWIFRADFSLMNIPHIHPYSMSALNNAKRWSHFASLFLILHELAHMAHRHTRQGIEAEFEADVFALEALLQWKAQDPDAIILAIDHLFQVMCLTEVINRFGIHVSRKASKDLPYMQRREKIRSYPGFRARMVPRIAGQTQNFERTIEWFLELLPSAPDDIMERILKKEPGL